MRRAFATGLSLAWILLTSGCFAIESFEVGCLEDVTIGEDADEEDIERELSLYPCIAGDLIMDNTLAASLSLPDLNEIGGSLAVSLNVRLRDIELVALERVGGLVDIRGNPALERVELPALSEVGGDLYVVDNPELPPCEAQAVASAVERIGGAVVLEGNLGQGCP